MKPSGADAMQALSALAAKQAIAQNLAVHSRGIDRADADLIASAYHADAQVDYGFFNGPAAELAQILGAAQKGQPITLHRPSNLWIKLDGSDQARSEAYVIAYTETAADTGDGRMQRLIFGRYLDRHRYRDGAWRLSHRTYVLDANLNWPGCYIPPAPAADFSRFQPTGGQGGGDPGNALLALARASFRSSTQQEARMAPAQDQSQAALIDDVLSKQALHELLMAYCRGVDRTDADLLRSTFHPDAQVITGVFNGGAMEFVDFIVALVRDQLKYVFHSVANEWFEIRGDDALGESYAIALATVDGPDGPVDVLTGGRYIDRFARRDGAWKIASRSFVCDWTISQSSSVQMNDGMYAALSLHGKNSMEDPVYAHWR
ncbi:MAG: hypothetical protein Tsb0016_14450 [Sphingomonadales bacterium]